MLEWLLAPIDATRGHGVGPQLSWHARLMVLAWVFLVPIGILTARFFKIWPGQNWPQQLDNRNWWTVHRGAQYSAVALMGLGLGLILSADPSETVLPGPHALLGWALLVLAGLQVISGVLRGTKGGPTELDGNGSLRGDHFDMTVRRKLFEYIHKFFGHAAMLLSVPVVVSGLWQANGPRWMWVALVLWWFALIGIFTVCQRRGMAFDTYQAIWGPDADLPGNQQRPIGLGVRVSRRDPAE